MIGLRIASGALDLAPDTSIRLRYVSPLFANVSRDNSHSLAFDLPRTNHNRLRLGFPSELGVAPADLVREHPATLLFDGFQLHQGQLVVSEAGDRLRARFLFDAAPAWRVWNAMRLNQLDLATFDIERTVHQQNAGVAPYLRIEVIRNQASDVTVRLALNGHIESRLWTQAETPGDFLQAFMNQLNANTPTHNVVGSVGGSGMLTLQPAAYGAEAWIQFHVEFPDDTYFYTWDVDEYVSPGEVATEAMRENSYGWREDGLGGPNSGAECAFCQVHAPNLLGDPGEVSYPGWVNWWDGDFFRPVGIGLAQNFANALIPFPRVRYLFERAAHAVGAEASTPATDFDELFVWTNRVLGALEDAPQLAGGPVLWFASKWDMRDFVPDLSVGDFLRGIMALMNVAAVTDRVSGDIEFTHRSSVFENEQEDWREKTLVGHQISFLDAGGHRFRFLPGGDSNAYFDGKHSWYSELTVADGKQKIDATAAPLIPVLATHPADGHSAAMASTMQRGAISPFEGISLTNVSDSYNRTADPGLYVFFNRAIQPHETGTLLVTSSVTAGGYGSAVAGNDSLSWGGETGLYQRYWREWVENVVSERELRQVLLLDLLDLASLDYTRPKRIATATGSVLGVLAQLDVTLTMQGIEPATAKFYVP